MKTTLEQARAAKRTLAFKIGSLPEVNGIGITRENEGYALKVNLTRPVYAQRLPDKVEGVNVSVDVVGPAMPA